MKNKKHLLVIIITIVYLSVQVSTPLNRNQKISIENIRPASISDNISTVVTWNTSSDFMNNNSYTSLSLNMLSENLTEFNPINSTSYTGLDSINITWQPSNESWSHFRDFENDSSLPSTNLSQMPYPYDTSVFFARNGSVYNITASWENEILSFGSLDSKLFIFNQSQFHDFENYIKPWNSIPFSVGTFQSSHGSDDWLYEYNNQISNGILPQILNETTNFNVLINKTGWYYLVMWGEGNTGLDKPKIATYGDLLSEGPENVNVSVSDLMNIYRPSLGREAAFVTAPSKVYERVVRGDDEFYNDSLVLLYIYEFSTRQIQNSLVSVDFDWVPLILYVNPNSIGRFPDRIVYYHDETWLDLNDRNQEIYDPNFNLGEGIFSYDVNVTPEFAPFLNDTVSINASVSTQPISSENRIGAAPRVSLTTNSHGVKIESPYDTIGTTFSWDLIPRLPLDDTTLRTLYRDRLNDFITNGWLPWSALGMYYPEKTPFTLYFNSLFTAPYLVSGLENLMLVTPEVSNWINGIDQDNLFFNSSLQVKTNITVDIPVNFNLIYPENEPSIGQESNFTLVLGEMGNPNITIDYSIDFNMSFNMMLISGSYNMSTNNTLHFVIPLQEIDFILQTLDISDGLSDLVTSKTQTYVNAQMAENNLSDYVTIENFSLGTHIVGNLVSCDIRIHLWPIIKEVGKNFLPPWFTVVSKLVDKLILDDKKGLELILSPQLQGIVAGKLVGDGLEFSNGGQFEFNETQKTIQFQAIQTQNLPQTSFQLQNLSYYMNFMVNWTFEVNFNKVVHFFGQKDLSWDLGTYPFINFAENPMNNSDILLLGWNELPLIFINYPEAEDLYGINAPDFQVEIIDKELNKMWYTVDGGITNITFTTNGTINQALWDEKPNGTVTIRFYANNSYGLEDFAEVIVRKDIFGPINNWHSKILIDGNSALDSFFSGNGTDGTFSNPYILENYSIDANGSGSGIEIRNTDKYVIIRNCTIKNSSGSFTAGIYLSHTSNINITQNYVSENFYAGIELQASSNITVSGNRCFNNTFGINIENSGNNNITGNNCSDNTNYGIHLDSSSDNTITGNNCSGNTNYGIYLRTSSDNTIMGNLMSHNDDDGTYLMWSNYNNITENVIFNNGHDGIYLNDSDYNEVYWNLIYDNTGADITNLGSNNEIHDNIYSLTPDGSHSKIIIDGNAALDQFCMFNFTDGTPSNPHVIDNYIIDAGGSGSPIDIKNTDRYLIIQNCTVTNSGTGSTDAGIYLNNCTNVKIMDSNAKLNIFGIYLYSSTNNTITGNNCSSNTNSGIRLYVLSEGNTISGNNCSDNSWGIDLFALSDNNTLTGNNCSGNNIYGILLSTSFDNMITGNNCSDNSYGIYLLSSSGNNTITGNNCSGNNYGIRLDNSNNNTIWTNYISNNSAYEAQDANGEGNFWDNNLIGNYWGNYIEKYPSASDIGGIWDTPYQIGGNSGSEDRYPLVNSPLENTVTSSEYDYEVGPIVINGSSGWSSAVTTYAWCTGSGTWGDPYIIEKVYFNGAGDHGLTISNSRNYYFEIKNCKSNSSTSYLRAGIFLDHTSNGTLYSNNCSLNYFGIYLYYSDNITLTGNNCSGNTQDGIFLSSSDNNTLTGNNCSGSVYGIYLEFSSDNKIMSNNCSDNEYGIVLSSSSDNTITGNNCSYIIYFGIKLGGSSNNTITGNNCLYNDADGIRLSSSSDNTITGNNCSDNGIHGIQLGISSDNNTITGNNCSGNERLGIRVYSSFDNTITGNNCSDNGEHGIELFSSSDNTITGNNCSGNERLGIRVYSSSDNTITGNNCSDNGEHGIELFSSSDNNTITGNNCSDNGEHGIDLSYSDNNTILLNNISYNNVGIHLDNSNNNTIWTNYLSNNSGNEAEDTNGEENFWDNNFIGNYWGDYTEKYPNALDKAGIWNVSYEIMGTSFSIDRYPLVNSPFEDSIPHANFSANSTMIITGMSIQFNDTSTGGNPFLNYQWDFNDGSSNSTEINPIHKFTSSGIFVITLTVNDSDGDVSIFNSISITVVDVPSSFILNSNADSPDSDGNYDLTWEISTYADNYSVYVHTSLITDINGSLTLLSLEQSEQFYNISGLTQGTRYYVVVATNENGITTSNCLKIVVKFVPGGFTLNSNADTPDSDGNYDLIWGSSAGADNYTVYIHSSWITDINGSVSSLTTEQIDLFYNFTNQIEGIYFYLIESNNEIGSVRSNCLKITVLFEINSLIIHSPYEGEIFGNNPPNFNVGVKDNNIDELWYTVDNGITNVTFTINGTIDQTLWDNLPNGTVTIKFFVNNSLGAENFTDVTVRKDINAPIITINDPQPNEVFGTPAPNFNISITEPNLDKTWYSLNSGTNTTFTGFIGTFNQILWEILPEGNVTIRFYANDSVGNMGFAELNIRKDVNIPIAVFSANATTIFEGESILFTDETHQGDLPYTYEWDFGDGTANSTNQHPIHQFVNPDIYTVTLSVWDVDGDFDTTTTQITVLNNIPFAVFSTNATTIYEGESIQFTDETFLGDLPYSYEWNFGDGTVNSTNQNPIHQFVNPDIYTVKLSVWDVDSDYDTYTVQITVLNNIPFAVFSTNATTIYEGESIQFTDETFLGDLPYSYEWNFGDGTANSTNQNPIHQFVNPDIYTVKLSVWDVDSDYDTYTVQITVLDNIPVAVFSANATTIYEGESIQFSDETHQGDLPYTYEWDFGDGTVNSTERNPIHQFANRDIYIVTLNVWDIDGDFNTITMQVSVMANIPVAVFSANVTTIYEGESILFTDETHHGDFPYTYEWNFDDGTVNSAERNPIHQFANPNTYTVILSVWDVDGDFDNITLQITVLDNIPVAVFSTNATMIYESESIQFTDETYYGDLPYTYEWDFGDGTVNSTVQYPFHQFTNLDIYTVTLSVWDVDGDYSTITMQITVLDNIPVAVFRTNATTIYEGQSIQFTDESHHGDLPYTYDWNFGDGTVNSEERNPIHKYDSAGTYTVILTITDIDGDSDIVIETVYILVQSIQSDTPGIPGYNFALIPTMLLGMVILILKIRNNKNKDCPNQ